MAREGLRGHRLFWQEFRTNFDMTGAVLPSGRPLATALSRLVQEGDGPKRILEAGPGTGAVSRRIIKAMKPDDTLDLVEWNGTFVDLLRQHLVEHVEFRYAAPRVSVYHQKVEDLPGESHYDAIVSGLPLNNFGVDDVERILSAFLRLLKPGGTLSFFEYMGVRYARGLVGNRPSRERLAGITRALSEILVRYEFRRDWIWRNVPPAWVHHCRIADSSS